MTTFQKILLAVILLPIGTCVTLCGIGLVTGAQEPDAAPAVLTTGAPAEPEASLEEVDAAAYASLYRENEVKANAAYKGKRFILVGVVDDVREGAFDDVIAGINTDNAFVNIDAHLTSKALAVTLSKGDRVRLACTGNGMTFGRPQLSDCSRAPDLEVEQ